VLKVPLLTSVRLGMGVERTTTSLRFGHPVKEVCHGTKQSRRVYFTAGDVFCCVISRADEIGPQRIRLDVLRAVSPGQRSSTLIGVQPGAEILLRVGSEINIARVLELIHCIEQQRIQPYAISSDYWRTVHNRLCARVEVVPFRLASHAAYLSRRRFLP
jgi:hypothetical protein